MLYHVIRRPLHNSRTPTPTPTTNRTSSNKSSTTKLMPRYHYSRVAPTSSHTPSPDSFLPRHPLSPTTTTSNNTNTNPSNSLNYASFKSTFIPLVTTNRTNSSNKRETIPIPITREEGTTQNNENALRTVPITFVSSNTNNSKPQFTSFLRPGSKYFQHQTNSTNNLNVDESLSANGTTVPRLPSVSRRLSLTSPIVLTSVTNVSSAPSVDDETIVKPATIVSSSSSIPRPIPIRFPQSSMLNNHSRTTSAILRSVPKSNVSQHTLQRQKTDLTMGTIGDTNLNSSTEILPSATSQRRADVMAREAIQGVVRFQQQQQQQTSSNDSSIDLTNYNHISMRSPAALSRRVIINLKNNQSVSLDSRLLSANPTSMRPPIVPSALRRPHSQLQQHVEIQIPSHPTTLAIETSPSSSSTANLSTSFKNEFRMEIPVNVLPTSQDLETSFHSVSNRDGEDDDDDDDQDSPLQHQQSQSQTMLINERIISANPNSTQTLKSILKRSSSRENVGRKNVSFMNA